MRTLVEIYQILVTAKGVEIHDLTLTDTQVLSLAAGEALMLMDILNAEKETLQKIAQDESPAPFLNISVS